MITSILPKISTCIDCVTNGDLSLKEIVAGRCKYHYKIHSDQRKYQKLKEKQKVRSLILSPENKKMLIGKAIVKDENLELWFLYVRQKMTGRCECGCNKPSSKLDDKHFKSSVAHLLAKSKFKSIATHPDNWIELNFWEGCHTTFDNMGYEYCKEKKPILWDIVVDRFKKVYPFIAEEEKKHIPEILLNTLNNN